MKASKSIIYSVILVLGSLLAEPYRLQAIAEKNTDQTNPSDCYSRIPEGKDGLFIEDSRYGLIETYYKGGRKDGIFRAYYRNGKLRCFGEYTNDKRTGIWYYFNEKSELYLAEKEITINAGLTTLADGKVVKAKVKSYVIEYYDNGRIKEEGIALYDESVEVDFLKKGIWKYYDCSGKLIRTEDNN